jgi:hypothetical protein
MTFLPTDAFAAAEFLVRHMYRPIDFSADARFFAIPETEHPIGGDIWFWSDDNAKILEFMSRPELWQRYPRETAEILRFVQAMCRGPFIFRRISPARLEATEQRGTIAGYRHALMNVRCDLSRGAVIAGIRFHDERTYDNLLLTGNVVEFTYRTRKFRLSVEKAISESEASQDGPILTLRYSADLSFKPRWREIRLGHIGYVYRFDARSMLIDVEVTLDLNPGLEVSDVVLTVSHNELGNYLYTTAVADGSCHASRAFSAGKPGREILDAGGASYYQIRQGQISGDALAVHSIPRDAARLSGIETLVQHPGVLQRARARYEFTGSQRGARLIAAESKLLTGGGFYERIADYAGFMRQAVTAKSTQHAAWDLSTSYDYGSKINAFAKCFAVCAAGEVVPDPANLADELRALFDRYLGYYCVLFVDARVRQPTAIFSRDLAFVILGVSTMYHATQADEYRRQLQRLCDALLDFEVPFDDLSGEAASGFLMRMNSPRAAYVDCHSAALLALTQAARFIDDPRIPAAIDRGLASYGVLTCGVDIGRPYKIDTVSTSMADSNGNRAVENAFWNFKAGMTLRFFAALRCTPNPALQALAARHGERLELFEFVLRRQIEHSITRRDDAIEIRTAVPASETNSETQPWVMLGLLGHPAD